MPYSKRTAFFLGGGKAMINALYATAAKLGVVIGYGSEVVALAFGDDRACEGRHPPRRPHRARDIEDHGAVRGGHQANLGWLRESYGAAADGFAIRGTPHDTGAVLRLLLDAGIRPVGDPARAPHGRGRCARAEIRRRHRHPALRLFPTASSSIVTASDATTRGEDSRKTHFAQWGARIGRCPGPDRPI